MRKLFTIIFILLLAGFVNAAYIAVETLQQGSVACYVVQGCDKVLTSPYAHVWGISVSWWGMLFYLVGLILLFVSRKRNRVRDLLWWYLGVGVLVSLWFLYIQAFVLHAFCSSCLLSAIFVISAMIFSLRYRGKTAPQNPVL